MIRKLLSVAALAVTLLVPAAAQQTALRLLAFEPPLKMKEVFIHDPATAAAAPVTSEIKSYLNHENSLVELRGREVVVTTSADPGSAKDPKSVVGKATLPAGTRAAILLFLPQDAPGGGKRVLVIPDSRRDFPAGSINIVNLSPYPVQVKLEGKDFNFLPGKSDVIEDPPVGADMHADMEAIAYIENKPRRVHATRWGHPGGSRRVQVIFQEPGTGFVKFRGFDDVPPRDPQAEAATAQQQ